MLSLLDYGADMKTNEHSASRRSWRTPEIVEIGNVVETTGFSDLGNLRDNQGSTPVHYTPFTENPPEEVDLDAQ